MRLRVLFAILAIVIAHFSCAQTTDYSSYLAQAWECLNSSNCDAAQRNYDMYKEMTGNRNPSLEGAISRCIQEKSVPAKYIPQGYVDLGLPSGTLWKANNEDGFYTYDDAIKKYGTKLPSCDQFQELKNYCTYVWYGSGYKFTGRNGNSIILPAAGHKRRSRDKSVEGVGNYGAYWSIENVDEDEAKGIHFFQDFPSFVTDCSKTYKSNCMVVRLVYNN